METRQKGTNMAQKNKIELIGITYKSGNKVAFWAEDFIIKSLGATWKNAEPPKSYYFYTKPYSEGFIYAKNTLKISIDDIDCIVVLDTLEV